MRKSKRKNIQRQRKNYGKNSCKIITVLETENNVLKNTIAKLYKIMIDW